MVVGARQCFQFFRQITWFLGNKRGFSKFWCWIFHNLISINQIIKKKHSLKANFKATLRIQ